MSEIAVTERVPSAYSAIASENMRMARFTDQCRPMAELLNKILLAAVRYCDLNEIDPQDIRPDMFWRRDGEIVIRLTH